MPFLAPEVLILFFRIQSLSNKIILVICFKWTKTVALNRAVKLCYALAFKALCKPVSPIAILKQITFSKGHMHVLNNRPT